MNKLHMVRSALTGSVGKVKYRRGDRYSLTDRYGNSSVLVLLDGVKDEVVFTPLLNKKKSKLVSDSKQLSAFKTALAAAGIINLLRR